MTFRTSQLENMVTWCSRAEELRDARDGARRMFFGEDHARPVRYLPGAGNLTSKERRFLGWFALAYELHDGRRPGEVAAAQLYSGSELDDALNGMRNARYLLGIVTTSIPGRILFLELEDECFEVRSRELSRLFSRDQALVSWLVTARPCMWIPGPGWTEWPVRLGPNIRQTLKKLQPDPIQFERLLQMRSDRPESEMVERPKDTTLEAAVARLTEAAKTEGRLNLVMSVEEWRRIVLDQLGRTDMTAFTQKVMDLVGAVQDPKEVNRWLALAVNIWNATPQPDRGGRTAYELSKEEIIPFQEPQEKP